VTFDFTEGFVKSGRGALDGESLFELDFACGVLCDPKFPCLIPGSEEGMDGIKGGNNEKNKDWDASGEGGENVCVTVGTGEF
jgi:hypothetical protein